MSDHRDAIVPPKPIPAVPPVTEEAKRIARGDYMPPIGAKPPTWRDVFKGFFKKDK